MKHILFLCVLLCTGCSTVFEHGKFYITSDSLPTITNDKKYGNDKEINKRIIIYGDKIEYQIVYAL